MDVEVTFTNLKPSFRHLIRVFVQTFKTLAASLGVSRSCIFTSLPCHVRPKQHLFEQQIWSQPAELYCEYH
jgi:hypothetical protein